MQKVLLVIFGVLMFIGGVYMVATPGLAFAIIAPLTGIAMLVDAIGGFCAWSSMRKTGNSDTWTLVASILSLVLGVVILGSIAVQFALDAIIAWMVAFWLIVNGIMRIASSLKLRKIVNSNGWIGILILGILMILSGIFGLVNPLVIVFAVGMMMGISIMVSGISCITMALAL